MKKLYYLVLASFCQLGATEQWTQTYSHLCRPAANAPSYVYSKMTKEHPFSQLIFSWNGIRPTKGSIKFYVRSFDAQTSAWDSWHLMGEWGAGVQKSCFSRGLLGSALHYVRLEVPRNRLANGFAIKMEAVGGAQLKSVRLLSVNSSRLEAFQQENSADYAHRAKKTVLVSGVPKISQMALDHTSSKALCSPTSCAMLVGFILNKYVDPCLLAEGVYDQGLAVYGSWPFNVAHSFEQCQGRAFFRVERLNSFAELYTSLQNKKPLAVSVRGDLPGAPKSFPKGHILVVVGFDAENQRVICHDPAWKKHEEVQVSYALKDFLAAWGRSHYLAYTFEKASHKKFLMRS